MESFQKEKQIVVDPLSLKDSLIKLQEYQVATNLPTIITTSLSPTHFHPPTLQPPKSRFLNLSLPNSVNSSPRFASVKKSKGGSPETQSQEATNVTNKLQNYLQEAQFGKSKSCGDGRESSSLEEFDHWLNKVSAKEYEKWEWHFGTSPKNEDAKENSPKSVKSMKTSENDYGFKCNALCIYLPNFVGKVKLKQIKTKKEVSQKVAEISRTVSLENFECGSWASAAMSHENDGDSNNSYFDLPLELMKCGDIEVDSPMAASFVYEKNIKGVLKNGSARGSGRKFEASPRHVRFSLSSSPSYPTSPVSCISPRLRKAREDFNAFLAAQRV
ncbi:uncharacterized protein [Cicer arietinum]|uniref:Uncharacterized protein LOC101496468 n=1 Tax=Cicer arietinum TaxID=3827 RepID=A0A1S2XEU0_CICAR|nr:uncharacterized protein LOC101496468 [Cicer arietinum]